MRPIRFLAPLFLVLACAFPQGGGVELVVNPDAADAEETRIHALEFTDQSTLRAVVTHGRDTSVAKIGGDEDSVRFLASILPHTAVSLAGDMLVGLAPLQAEVFDIRGQKQINTIKTEGIDAWPLACARTGVCAWQSGETIHVQSIRGQGKTRDFPVGGNAVLSLDISANGRLLAAGVNDAKVRIWDLQDGRELPPVGMEATPDGSLLGAPVSLQGVVPRSFVVPHPGMATVVRFSPDASLLAAGNETGIHVWRLASGERAALLRGYQGRVSALAFSGDSRRVAVASEDKAVRLFTLAERPSMVEVGRLATLPHFLALRSDAKFVAAGLADGSIELWKTDDKALSARVRVLEDGWIATVPSGLFDASEQAWRRAAWRFGGPSGKLFPIESFYRDFYRPGLLSDVLSGTPLPHAIDIGTVRPAPPVVTLTMVEGKPPRIDLIPGQGMRNTPERMRFRIEARPGGPKGAIADMQLALNGIVVKDWPGEQALNASGAAVREMELEIPPGDLRVTAYAFDESDVRSAEAVWERPRQGWGHQVEQRTLHVLAIGIGAYKNPKFTLNFADSDARLVAATLGMSETELQKVSRKVMDWSNQRALETLHPVRQQEVAARTQVKTLVNEQATRAGVLNALRELARTAEPKDAVVIFYAGHGLSDQDHYYLLPWDMGLGGAPGAVNAKALKKVRSTLISDDDIADALSDLKVKYGALILDSCYSGQALEGSELVGPIRLRGLTGLAYEKGISLLAASESSDPSFEIKKLGASVLTYALIREGLQQGKADGRPLDGRIELEEWLRYAPARVPSLVSEANGSSAGAPSSGVPVQQARFAPARKPRSAFLVLTAAEKEP
jgi:hypothetical protein